MRVIFPSWHGFLDAQMCVIKVFNDSQCKSRKGFFLVVSLYRIKVAYFSTVMGCGSDFRIKFTGTGRSKNTPPFTAFVLQPSVDLTKLQDRHGDCERRGNGCFLTAPFYHHHNRSMRRRRHHRSIHPHRLLRYILIALKLFNSQLPGLRFHRLYDSFPFDLLQPFLLLFSPTRLLLLPYAVTFLLSAVSEFSASSIVSVPHYLATSVS